MLNPSHPSCDGGTLTSGTPSRVWQYQSRIYYAAYVFFEKQRLQQGKSKDKKREENEKVWALERGIDTKRRRGNVMCVWLEKSLRWIGMVKLTLQGNSSLYVQAIGGY